jgi:hypothetical protein
MNMKKRQLLLTAFLLMLYICPAILAVNSSSLPIFARPNMTKDFAVSESVTYYNTTPHVADSGTDDFADSRIKDDIDFWTTDALVSTYPEYAYFIINSSYIVESFNYSFYGSGDHSWLKYYNGASLVDLEYINNPANHWQNGTITSSLIGNNITLAIHSNASEYYLDCDYLAITYSYRFSFWQEINEIKVYFHIPFDYWAVDMFFIIFGLGLLVLSSVYAAYKIKNNPNTETIFIIILVFMIGLGLFLGGIGFGG